LVSFSGDKKTTNGDLIQTVLNMILMRKTIYFLESLTTEIWPFPGCFWDKFAGFCYPIKLVFRHQKNDFLNGLSGRDIAEKNAPENGFYNTESTP
jgi:hypothetical protein